MHVRRGGLIIHSPWLRCARRKRHRRRLHPHAQVLTHHTLTNDAVSARRFKVYTNATLSNALWEQSYVIRAAGSATRHRLRRLRLHRHRPHPQARRRVRVKGGSGQLEAAACATHRGLARSWRASWPALLLVLARRIALLGLLQLPSGLVPPDGGSLCSRRWRHFLRFWIHTSSFFLVLDPHKLHFWFWIHTSSILVLDPHKSSLDTHKLTFLVWIHTRQLFGFGSTQANFLVWIHARQLFLVWIHASVFWIHARYYLRANPG